MDMDRATHLQWCKDRALEYVELGDLHQAIASMTSDLGKHPDTALPWGVSESALALMLFRVPTKQEVIEWINGFN